MLNDKMVPRNSPKMPFSPLSWYRFIGGRDHCMLEVNLNIFVQ